MGGTKSKPRSTTRSTTRSRTRYNKTAEMNKLKRDLESQKQANAARLTEIEQMKTNQAKALKDWKEQAEKRRKEQIADYERQEREKKRANDTQMENLKVNNSLIPDRAK